VKGLLARSGELSNRNVASAALLWAQASHDLRQPVQALLFLTHTILSDTLDRGTLRRTVERMDDALYGLQRKLELLNELSQLEANRKRPELRPCSLADLHDGVMRQMEAVAEGHGIGLRSRSPRGVVRGDAKLLSVLFKSLIMNAIRLGRDDDILVGWRRRGGSARLEVYFKAPPISATQAQTALIELRHQTKEKTESVFGLGLGFIEHLSRAMDVGLEHKPLSASGQRFSLMLPLVANGSDATV
jgi:two-component system, sensor histidine kinase